MTDKLAEEILFGYRLKAGGMTEADMIEAMQAYHEAANKQVTEDDIEAFADKFARADSNKSFERGEWLGIKEGVRAMRDGEIKHIDA